MTMLCKRIALATSALTALVAAPAFAQDDTVAQSAVEQSTNAGDIVVTARRVEERLQDVPISITVFTPQQIADRNIVSTTDLAAYTPSLSVNSRFGPEKASFAIRGFSQDLNTLPTVGVYFADVVAPRLSSNITSGNGAGPGSMFDLQNVQVLKGPQGTLFGRNTTGGAILLVPQKPTDRLEGYVEGTYGNYDARRLEAVVNVPLAETFKVRAGVDWNKRDGYLRNRSGIGPDDFNDRNYIAARLSILGELTPDLENYTVVTYAHSDTNGSTGSIVYCDPLSTGSLAQLPVSFVPFKTLVQAHCDQLANERAAGFGFYDVQNSQPNAFVEQRTWQIINTTTWRASDTLTVKNIASYGEAREDYAFNINGDNTPFPFVMTNPGPNRGQGRQWTMTEELQFQGRTSDDRLQWQAGGYMEISRPIGGEGGQTQWTQLVNPCTDVYTFRCRPLSLPNPLAPGGIAIIGNVGIAKNVYYYRNFGLYAQATYQLTDQFSVTAGIRNTWDWQKSDADNVVVTPEPNGTGPRSFRCSRAFGGTAPPGLTLQDAVGGTFCTRSFVQKSSEPTWLLGVDYEPNEDLLLYAKYARGYRGGGINEANLLAETWDPEKLDTYEVGVKATFRGPIRGNVSVAGFWNEFRDQQASVFIPQCTNTPANPNPACTQPAFTGINGIQNVGKSRIRGIEADAMILLHEDVRLEFGYAYLDAKVTGGSVPFCNPAAFDCARASFLTAGTTLPFAPKNRITAGLTFFLPIDESLGRLSLGGNFVHTDKYFSSHSNDAAFAAGRVPFNASIAPATDLINLNMNWKGIGGSPLDLAVFATNVTNEKYHVAAAGGISTFGAEYVFLGEPRMYGVRLRYNFGD
jgi:iron complex outermembrane recepter protein